MTICVCQPLECISSLHVRSSRQKTSLFFFQVGGPWPSDGALIIVIVITLGCVLLGDRQTQGCCPAISMAFCWSAFVLFCFVFILVQDSVLLLHWRVCHQWHLIFTSCLVLFFNISSLRIPCNVFWSYLLLPNPSQVHPLLYSPNWLCVFFVLQTHEVRSVLPYTAG